MPGQALQRLEVIKLEYYRKSDFVTQVRGKKCCWQFYMQGFFTTLDFLFFMGYIYEADLDGNPITKDEITV
jgi:hypothetical protein